MGKYKLSIGIFIGVIIFLLASLIISRSKNYHIATDYMYDDLNAVVESNVVEESDYIDNEDNFTDINTKNSTRNSVTNRTTQSSNYTDIGSDFDTLNDSFVEMYATYAKFTDDECEEFWNNWISSNIDSEVEFISLSEDIIPDIIVNLVKGYVVGCPCVSADFQETYKFGFFNSVKDVRLVNTDIDNLTCRVDVIFNDDSVQEYDVRYSYMNDSMVDKIINLRFKEVS